MTSKERRMSGWLSYVLEVAVLVLSVTSMLSVGPGTLSPRRAIR